MVGMGMAPGRDFDTEDLVAVPGKPARHVVGHNSRIGAVAVHRYAKLVQMATESKIGEGFAARVSVSRVVLPTGREGRIVHDALDRQRCGRACGNPHGYLIADTHTQHRQTRPLHEHGTTRRRRLACQLLD